MKRFVWILVGGLLLAQPGLALKPASGDSGAGSPSSELSDELGAFVQQAVEEGLLDPAGKGGRDVSGEPAAIVSGPARPAFSASGSIDCSAPYPLDFAHFDTLKTYGDIYAYRGSSPESGETAHVPSGPPGVELAKAYIALDLASEAAMTVKSARDQESVAVYHLSRLLDGLPPERAAYFSELASCYPRARIWQSLELISQRDPAGPSMLEAELTAYRQLPLHLRDRAAMIAIPELDALGQRNLGNLLMAAFSEEEIANSGQLRFSQAVLELGKGSREAEQLIGQFLIQSRFQAPALAALIRHKRPVDGAMREILVDDMVNRIETAQLDADVRGDLRFVLDEMSAGSMYSPMLKLVELPSMQSPAAREELASSFATSLQRDLASDDSLRSLAAIEALIRDPGLLDASPDRAALYGTATEVAVRLGFGALGDTLASKAQGGDGAAEQRAVLAYRQKKFEEVFALAAKQPKNQKINRIAALAAIDANDRVRLAGIEPRLALDPETILALIEQDAAQGRWIVSGTVYDAASRLTEEGHRARVARVTALKAAPPEPAPSRRLAMTSIPGKLKETRASLGQLASEEVSSPPAAAAKQPGEMP